MQTFHTIRTAMRRVGFIAVMACAAAGATLQAQQTVPELRSNHPTEYTVQRGDTLWDLAGKFLIRPWEWPHIWQANPQIENPHLIYPGDVLQLSYIDGEPVLQVVRRSPDIRVIDEEPISAIRLEDLREHLRWPRLVSEADMKTLPYVVATEQSHLLGSPLARIYVRGLDVPPDSRVIIASRRMVYSRRGQDRSDEDFLDQYKLPEYEGHILRPQFRRDTAFVRGIKNIGDDEPYTAHELFEVATATVLKSGAVSTLEIEASKREVKAGYYVLPFEDYAYQEQFYPHAMEAVPESAKVIGLLDAGPIAGHMYVIMLNVGSADGVEAGHVFSVMSPGETVNDPIHGRRGTFKRLFTSRERANVKLPDEHVARAMVYRSYPHVSYALIMDGGREVHVGDHLSAPSPLL